MFKLFFLSSNLFLTPSVNIDSSTFILKNVYKIDSTKSFNVRVEDDYDLNKVRQPKIKVWFQWDF